MKILDAVKAVFNHVKLMNLTAGLQAEVRELNGRENELHTALGSAKNNEARLLRELKEAKDQIQKLENIVIFTPERVSEINAKCDEVNRLIRDCVEAERILGGIQAMQHIFSKRPDNKRTPLWSELN